MCKGPESNKVKACYSGWLGLESRSGGKIQGSSSKENLDHDGPQHQHGEFGELWQVQHKGSGGEMGRMIRACQ